MESNKSRGNRTLVWMKASLILIILSGVMGLVSLYFWRKVGHSMSQGPMTAGDTDTTMYAMLFFMAVMFVLFVTSVVWSVYQIFWLMWIFRTTKNLRVVTSTNFSPWGAVICSCLPYVGLLIHYFVFKDLVNKTESWLSARQEKSSEAAKEILAKVQPVNLNLVNGFAIMGLLAGSIGFIRETTISGILTVAFALTSFICYMKSFAALIKEEQAMFEVYEDEKIMAKVDQVLWQRKMEESASSQSQNSAEKT